ncbi:U-box domain-containing protein 3 [Sesamum alatum]|uniref:RING-type E3 ubiquitin transferase n=1 Tax=Sesamum alatum TaxID=300844 RepID=A0AAE1Z420_9LAMI|nr:U-box domain-containing protein 3 [Sesamum alatum]
MDLTSLRCLINNISRFIHLVTWRVSETVPAEKDHRSIASLLKHLKLVLDDVADHKAPLGEALSKECIKLDVAVNEAREFLERWSRRKSKILCVLQTKPLLLKIQVSSVNLSCILCRLFEPSPSTSSLLNAQICMQESQNLKIGELSGYIEEILEIRKEGRIPDAGRLMLIVESLNLRSKQDLLSEFIAIKKERQKAEDSKTTGDLDQISQTVDLISYIRDCMVKENFIDRNGLRIPPYFRCPLSLELMLDPVIVASGQTYERTAIRKWLDHGLVTCPKTGNLLAHKNLIPNHTVKALITNWCDVKKVEFSNNPDNADVCSVRRHSEHIPCADDLQYPPQVRSSTSIPSLEDGHGFEALSASASTAITSIDYLPMASTEISRTSSKQGDASNRSGDITSSYSPSNRVSDSSTSASGKHYNSSKRMAEMVKNGSHSASRTLSSLSELGSSNLTTTSDVEKLIEDLKSASSELQSTAAREIRFLAKYNMENRFIIGQCGAITPLISLLHSDVELIQEHAVTALLNLSINEKIKARIGAEGAVEPLIHVLRIGNAGAKENAAAALFSLSLLDEYRIKIGRSGAVKPLVRLLQSGTLRGMKDAATALFNLSIFHENKARIVQAGAVKYLVRLMDPTSEMVDKAVALLANLSTITEGCSTIAREGGIPLLVEIVETGSQRGKENAASILLQLCISSPKYCRSILQEGAVPPLVALSLSGTPRAKEKAQQLLCHFRRQRESAVTRGRS